MCQRIGARSSLRKKASSLPNCHWNTKRSGANRKKKQQYETEDDALAFLKKHNLSDDFVAYLCPYCNKWHIGHRQDINTEPEVKSTAA